jgi:hypothetical protein
VSVCGDFQWGRYVPPIKPNHTTKFFLVPSLQNLCPE